MTTPDQIVAAARQYLGVPWRHQGRTKFGIDCGGLIILVGRELRLMPATYDEIDYSRRPDGWSFLEAFGKVMDEKPLTEAKVGDALIFIDGPYPCHTGILTEKHGVPHFIHAYAGLKKTIEQPYLQAWIDKTTHCFAYRQPSEVT